MIEINNATRTAIDQALVMRVAKSVMRAYRSENKELSIAFVGDVTIRRLNKAYRGKDRVTDILSFEGEGSDLGELVICYAQIRRQGPKFGHTARQELIFILVHGLLHLFGDTDETEKKRLAMIAKGEALIRELKLR